MIMVLNRRFDDAAWMARANGWVASALLALALISGGSAAPIAEMVVQIGATFALAWVVATPFPAQVLQRARTALGLLVLIVLLPIAQLIPLPPTVWTALPGRGLPRDALALIGAGDRWMPLSLDPFATRAAALTLIAPITLFLLVLRLPVAQRIWLIRVALGVGVIAVVLGLLQVAGVERVYLYDTTHRGAAVGLFANRSHNADFLLILMLCLAAITRVQLARTYSSAVLMVVIGAGLLLGLTVVTTTSRMALLMLPAVTVIAALMLVRHWPTPRVLLVRGGAVLALGFALIAVLVRNPVILKTLDRFGASTEGRYAFWPDVVYAVNLYWPWGTGLGTFDPVFRSVENLAIVDITYVVHAHNDFMELVLEAGWAGVALMLLIAAQLGAVAWRAWRRPEADQPRVIARAAIAGIAVVAVHSLVDYPLRTPAIITLTALLAGLLFAPVRPMVRADYTRL